MTASPNACRHCGIEQRGHARQWTPPSKGGPGWHQWTPPTQEQIKARMIARREDHPMSKVSFYGHGYCGDCDTTWEFGPVDDGTILESGHDCENNDSAATR